MIESPDGTRMDDPRLGAVDQEPPWDSPLCSLQTPDAVSAWIYGKQLAVLYHVFSLDQYRGYDELAVRAWHWSDRPCPLLRDGVRSPAG